jgi:uncharacterized protein (TIGR03067 family)
MTRYITTALVAVLLLAAAPAPKEDDEAKKLQGAWQAVTYEAAGMPQQDVAEKVACTCEKDVFTFQYEGKVIWKATFKLDPSKKPKAIDMTITEGPNKGQAIVGIYEVDKDALKWCTAIAGDTERPKEFGSQAGSNVALYSFKRTKP